VAQWSRKLLAWPEERPALLSDEATQSTEEHGADAAAWRRTRPDTDSAVTPTDAAPLERRQAREAMTMIPYEAPGPREPVDRLLPSSRSAV